MTFSPIQVAIAAWIKEALEQSDHIEWHKGLCGHVYSYVSDKGIVGGLSPDFVRYLEIFYDAVYSWKDYSGNPCYPIWLKTHKGSAATQLTLFSQKKLAKLCRLIMKRSVDNCRNILWSHSRRNTMSEQLSSMHKRG